MAELGSLQGVEGEVGGGIHHVPFFLTNELVEQLGKGAVSQVSQVLIDKQYLYWCQRFTAACRGGGSHHCSFLQMSKCSSLARVLYLSYRYLGY